MLMLMKRFGLKLMLGLLGGTILVLPYFFPGSTASAVAKAALWGFLGTLLLIVLCGGAFFWSRLRTKKPAAAKPVAGTSTPPTPTTKESKGQVGIAFLDALTYPFTWIYWGVLLWAVWLYSPKLLETPNLVWILIGLWMLVALVSQARMSSKMKNGGKEKKAAPGLTTATTLLQRLAFLATLGVIVYYGLIAPAGTWTQLTGRTHKDDPHNSQNTSNMIIPEGVPLNPNFTSRKLEHWEVTYVASNPQYQVPQWAWRKQKLMLLKEPGREVTDVVNLTVRGDPTNEALDIELSGACQAILDNRVPHVSKTCVGWWKDRGGQISGQFYLQVNEGGGRYFDVYLFDGNYLPKKSQLAMMLYGPPIPAIMLQFRPKDWSEDKN